MSYIPNPTRTEDFTGMPIVEEPEEQRNENALVKIAKMPLDVLINHGPNASKILLGSNWKSALIAQSTNAAAMMIAKYYGWNDTRSFKILSAIILRAAAGTLAINPVTSPLTFVYTMYDFYKLGRYAAEKVEDFRQYRKTSRTWALISWGGSKIGNLFFTKAPVIKNTARLTGGDSSSFMLESKANEVATLKQIVINNKPMQFIPENLQVLNDFKPKLTNSNFELLAEKLSYKSVLTDNLAQKYSKGMNNGIVSVKEQGPINMNNPKMIGEYTTNIQGVDSKILAEAIEKTQNKVLPEALQVQAKLIENVEQVEMVRELSFGGKIVLTAIGIFTIFMGYKFLQGKYPEYIPNVSFDWFYRIKDKFYNFFYKKKSNDIIEVIVDDENVTNLNTQTNIAVQSLGPNEKVNVNGANVNIQDNEPNPYPEAPYNNPPKVNFNTNVQSDSSNSFNNSNVGISNENMDILVNKLNEHRQNVNDVSDISNWMNY